MCQFVKYLGTDFFFKVTSSLKKKSTCLSSKIKWIKESKLRISSVFNKKIAYHTLRNKTKLYFWRSCLHVMTLKLSLKGIWNWTLVFLSVTVHEWTYIFQFRSLWYADSTNVAYDWKANVFLEFKFSKTLLLTMIPHQRGREGSRTLQW